MIPQQLLDIQGKFVFSLLLGRIGMALLYIVIHRAYDCGPVPAFVFAGVATLVRAIIFWIPSFFDIRLI